MTALDRRRLRIMRGEGPTATEIHEGIVSRYLMIRGFCRQLADDKKEDVAYGTALKEAVIYEVPEELFKSIYRAADYYTATEVAGLPWYDVDAHPNDPPEHVKDQMPHYWSTLETEGKKVPFPDKLPFDYCYFGFHQPPVLTAQQKVTYDVAVAPDVPAPYAIRVGLLVSREGNVWTLLLGSDSAALIGDYRDIDYPNGEVGFTFSAYPERLNGEWTHPLTLAPWFTNALAEWVNDHKVVSVEEVPRTLGFKRMCERVNKKRAKVARPIPPHYYAVTMRDKLIMEEDLERRFPKRRSSIDWQHQWLVTGHDRIRVKRGPLPLDPKVERGLLKRRPSGACYQIYRDSHPQGELAKELWRRGVKPKDEDEWMAILVSRIGDYVKGPEGKPLIPSTRRSGRNRPFTP
jgi:hypothetical protein